MSQPPPSSSMLLLPYHICVITYTYWYGLYYYTFGSGRYQSYQRSKVMMPQLPSLLPQHQSTATATTTSTSSSTTVPSNESSSITSRHDLLHQQINVHLYLLSCNFYLYHRNHYRKDTYVQDLQDNLSNVAIPGTSLPMSYFVYHNRIGLFCITVPFILFVYPVVSFIAAMHLYYVTTYANTTKNHDSSSIAQEYMIRLLAPNDWFTYWRYNSVLVALHAHTHNVTMESTMTSDSNDNTPNEEIKTTNFTIADEYAAENKWTFLQRGDRLGIPISPYMKTPTSLVIKHKNEEGGLGIYFYNNAAGAGSKGEWIFQERLYNSTYVASLLPPNAPLSTFRIITCSRGATKTNEKVTIEDIVPLSCVFRAGRDNAKTDHDAIFFNVDLSTGAIGGGTTNKHWYPTKNVVANVFHTPWRTYEDDRTSVHPDGNITVAGQVVPDLSKMKHIVQQAHCALCPHVPFCGWDIVLCTSTAAPICLLEVNLSCNFFRGTFDAKVRLIIHHQAQFPFSLRNLNALFLWCIIHQYK